ncbi:MAG: asparagine--tRNA ligase [Oscillospiraceae bacterium]|jgi:asparaginyl-tRNA synthetase|nr:asparagine--tRNA ligase [Oscillospiraceae bacterium]
MKHTDIIDILKNKSDYIGREVTVCGWVRTSRDSKNIAFLEINDGTTLPHLQIVIDKSAIPDTAQLMPLSTSVAVTGTCVLGVKNADTVEINAKSVTLIGASPLEYPIQKKGHSLEFLRTIPHLRVRTNTFNAMFRLRSKLSEAIHRYFAERNYIYVNTPIITGSDCEGAGEIFKVTSIGFSQDYKTEAEYNEADFFGQAAGLTVSGQLEGEVMACAFGKIYTFGPTFRAENSNTARHAAEFWQIEPEVAFAELDDIIEIATEMIKYIVRFVLETCPDELALFERFYEKGLREKLQSVVDSEFARVDYTEAIEILKKSGREFQYPVEWGCDLQTEHERYLTDVMYERPVFVVNYPKALKSFYMKQNADGKTVAATDLLVPGVGEIIGCSEREADYEKLLAAIESRGMKMSDYENYLDLRRFGSVPHSGFGLGLERMLMYLTGIGNIRDTTIYPRAKGDLK